MPFPDVTTFAFSLPKAGTVALRIFDVRGALVRALVEREYDVGSHLVVWDGRSDGGSLVGSGVYYAELRAGREIVRGKVVVAR